MRKMRSKVLAFALALTLAVGLLPAVSLAAGEDAEYVEYSIQVGQTIDLYGSFGLSDWESSDSATVRLDGTGGISPDFMTATGVALTEAGETVEVRRSYSVREGDSWSAERREEVFHVAVVLDLEDAPEGAIAILLGESVTLSATFGFSDWGSKDSSIARLDGTVDTSGNTIISPDQTTVTGVTPGTVDVIRYYFVFEDGEWIQKEEIFRIIVKEELDPEPDGDSDPEDELPPVVGGPIVSGPVVTDPPVSTDPVESDPPATTDPVETEPVESDSVVVVSPVTGGGSSSGSTTPPTTEIEIEDEDVPLAGTVELLDDHDAYIQGYSDGSVQPTANITREEAAAIFYRLLSEVSHALYDADENDFSDVSASRWSNTAISTLANAGILEGDNGAFRPSDNITRAEFATIVARFWVVTEEVTSPFTDTDGHWAEEYIAFAASRDWVNGYSDNTFRPQQSITRAEAVKLINRMLDREVDQEGLLEGAFQFTDNTDDAQWYYYEILEAANGHNYDRRNGKKGVENWTELTYNAII